jgi:hypothetical protein
MLRSYSSSKWKQEFHGNPSNKRDIDQREMQMRSFIDNEMIKEYNIIYNIPTKKIHRD